MQQGWSYFEVAQACASEVPHVQEGDTARETNRELVDQSDGLLAPCECERLHGAYGGELAHARCAAPPVLLR